MATDADGWLIDDGGALLAELEAREDLAEPSACLALLEASIGPWGTSGAVQAKDHRVGAFLIRRLADARYALAVPLLVKLAADGSPYARNRRDAVEALRAIGGPQTATAIVEALDGVIRDGSVPWNPHHPTLFVGPMIEALLVVDTADPFERLSPFFSREILARPGGARIAADVLTTISGKLRASAHEVVKMLAPDSAPRVRMGEDPRWVDLLVGLLADARLRPLAKHVLATVVRPMSPMAVEASYRRVAGPKIKAPAPPPLDETKVDAAKGEAESWALRLRATLEDALARMKRAKYGPRAKGKAVGGVDRVVTEGQIAEIEKLTRTRLPEMVRALYLIVGPIDFQGEFQRIDAKGAPVPIPAGLEAFRASPRLLIQPLSRALAGLKRRLREQTGVPVPLRDPLCLDLGEDLAVRVDVWRLDPPLEGSDETLGAHLRAHRGVEDPGARGLRRAYLGKAQGSTRLSRRGVSSA